MDSFMETWQQLVSNWEILMWEVQNQWGDFWRRKGRHLILFSVAFMFVLVPFLLSLSRLGWKKTWRKLVSQPKEHKNIIRTSYGLVLFGIWIFIFYLIGKDWIDLFENLLPNFITELFFIPITVFLVTSMIAKAQVRKAKKEAYQLLGDIHFSISYQLATDYLHIVSKRLHWSNKNTIKTNLRYVVNNIEKYVNEDFIHTPIKDDYNNWSFSHDEYLVGTKKIRDEKMIILSRYIAIMPRDMAEKLARVDNVLMSNSLMVATNEKGEPMTEVGGLPPIASYVSNHQLKIDLEELGEAIYDFYTYFDEYSHLPNRKMYI